VKANLKDVSYAFVAYQMLPALKLVRAAIGETGIEPAKHNYAGNAKQITSILERRVDPQQKDNEPKLLDFVFAARECTASDSAKQDLLTLNNIICFLTRSDPFCLRQGFPTCGTRTTSGTRRSSRWYASNFHFFHKNLDSQLSRLRIEFCV